MIVRYVLGLVTGISGYWAAESSEPSTKVKTLADSTFNNDYFISENNYLFHAD